MNTEASILGYWDSGTNGRELRLPSESHVHEQCAFTAKRILVPDLVHLRKGHVDLSSLGHTLDIREALMIGKRKGNIMMNNWINKSYLQCI